MNRQITAILDKAEGSFKIVMLTDSHHVDQQEDRVVVHQEAAEEQLVVGFRDLKDLSQKKDLIIETLTGPHHTQHRKLRNLMSQSR